MPAKPELSICIPCWNRSRMASSVGIIEPFPHTVDCLVRAVAEVGCEAELVVADYGSTDWPPAEWLPERAGSLPYRVLNRQERFSVGGGKNAAAEAASANVLFFAECDLDLPASLIRRGLEVVAEGKAYFPRYLRERRPGGPLYWGNGHGCCVVMRGHWEENRWLVGYGWGGADEDTQFAHWFTRRGLLVREDEPGLIHRWHPLLESKVATDALPGNVVMELAW